MMDDATMKAASGRIDAAMMDAASATMDGATMDAASATMDAACGSWVVPPVPRVVPPVPSSSVLLNGQRPAMRDDNMSVAVAIRTTCERSKEHGEEHGEEDCGEELGSGREHLDVLFQPEASGDLNLQLEFEKNESLKAQPDLKSGYEERAELTGHTSDVRGVLAWEVQRPGGTWAQRCIATSSRDATIRTYVSEGNWRYAHTRTLTGHTSYVGPLEHIPPGAVEQLPHGAIVSGSMDATVRVWSGSFCVHICVGHTDQVAALAALPGGRVASGSVDRTIRVWRLTDGVCDAVMEGHTSSVLCLAATSSGYLLSGSADATVRVWRGTECVAVHTGHTDTVRSIAVLPGADGGFVTGSHDLSVKVWDAQMGQAATSLTVCKVWQARVRASR
mmetsp:Transcript_25549/g.75534  ORF Transcript_25549/g.75534 Transcript_25549/m.75534 type:complete len:390 (-) Transcript_25549:1330-2499(-)